MKALIKEIFKAFENLCFNLLVRSAQSVMQKLSEHFAHSFALGVALVFFAVFALFFSLGMVVLLSEILNSWFWGLMLMSGINLVLMVVGFPIARVIGRRIFARYFK